MMRTVRTESPAQAPMFEFTAEHDALREVLRAYFSATSTVAPQDRWRRLLAEVGVDDILCGSGDSGATAIELAIVAEESGAALFGGHLLSTTVLGTLAGTDDGWAAATEQVCAGRRNVSAAVTSTCSGRSGLTMTESADGYRTDGSAEPVWDFDHSAFVVVDASLDGDPAVALFDGAAVDFAGLTGFDPSRPLGRMRCGNTKPLAVSTGADAVDALAALRRRGDPVISAELLGVAQWALDATVDYVGRRVQFGRTIGSFQAVKHRLADLLGQVELTRSAVYAAAWQIGDQPSATQTEMDLAVAAVLAREAAAAITKAAVQLHGGIAITAEHWAHRYLRRAHATAALTGSAAGHRRRLADLLDAAERRHG